MNSDLQSPYFALEELPRIRFRIHRLSYDPTLRQWDICVLTERLRDVLYSLLLQQKPLRGRVILNARFMLGHWTPIMVDLHRAVFRSEKEMRMSDQYEACYLPT